MGREKKDKKGVVPRCRDTNTILLWRVVSSTETTKADIIVRATRLFSEEGPHEGPH